MKTSFKIVSVFSIPIYIHITFLLIIPLFAWVFAIGETFTFFGVDLGLDIGFARIGILWLKILFGVLAAVLLFMCVLAHELGHSYVALKYGVKIKSITLLIIGGIATMEEIPKEPAKESTIAIVGPLTSLLLGGVAGVIFFILRAVPTQSTIVTCFTILFGILAFYNVFLAGFNLLPAFPMDGGRVLRAYLATKMNYIAATSKAASVGKAAAIVMGIVGVLVLAPLLILIAFIVYIGAGEEEKATVVSVTLEHIVIKDIMTPNVVSVPPTFTASQLIDFMLKHKHMGYPVMEDNMLRGIVTLSDVRKIAVEERSKVLVSEIMTKAVISIAPDAKAVEGLKLMVAHSIGRLLVMENGALVGIVSRTDLMKAIQILR